MARRLKSGEDVKTIIAERNAKPAASTATNTAAPKTDEASAEPTGQPAGAKKDGEADRFGLSEKDFNTLKRRGIEPGDWIKHIPPSNLKAMITQAAEAQAAADRAYQAQQAAKKAGKTGDQPNPTAAEAAADAVDAEQEANLNGGNAQPNPAEQQQQANEPVVFGQPAARWTMPEQSYQRLEQLGGKDVADAFKGEFESMSAFHAQQTATLSGVIEYLVDRLEDSDFNGALGDLMKEPGYDALDDAAKKTLRDEASNLIRAKGDLRNYGYKQALPIAAAGLFRTNVHTQAQAALAQRRAAALNGTPGRTEQRPVPAKPMTLSQQTAEIGRLMASGVNAKEARRQVLGD